MAVSVEAWIRNLGPLLNNSVAAVGSIRTPDQLSISLDALELALAGSWKISAATVGGFVNGYLGFYPLGNGVIVPDNQTWLVRKIHVEMPMAMGLGGRINVRAAAVDPSITYTILGDVMEQISAAATAFEPLAVWEGMRFCGPGTRFGLACNVVVDAGGILGAPRVYVEHVPFPIMT